MSHDSTQQLVQMANDIGNFFASEPEHQVAVDGVADHIHKFWEPRMRRRIFAHVEAGGAGLDPLPKEAIQQLVRVSATTT